MTKIWTQGHSLLELIVVLAILSILLLSSTFAWYLFEKQQITIFVARFNQALQLARMHAIASNQTIELCPTQNFHTCSSVWAEHFMVYNPKLQACLYQGRIPRNVKISTNISAKISFQKNGRSLENGTLTICSANQTHKLVIIASGRIRIA